jgi:hypothetical protein
MRSRALGVAVISVFLLAGCSWFRNDERIANDIRARMFSDSQLRGAAITVTVKNGEATLSGQVPSVEARYEAYRVAAETPGVRHVNDQMALQPMTPPQPVAEATPAPARPARSEPTPVRPRHPVTHHSEATAAASAAPAAPATAPASAPAPVSPAPSAPPEPQPERIQIPAGTPVTIRMIDSIDSSINHTGEIFHASLESPLVVDNRVVVPRGADVYVRLVEARSAGHMSGQSELRLELYRLSYQGKTYPLVSNDYDVKGTSRGKRTAATILGGSAIGAAIGAIAGGGKGAAIGAGSGAGAGAVYQAATRGQQVRIPSETVLNFQLQEPVEVIYNPAASSTRSGRTPM